MRRFFRWLPLLVGGWLFGGCLPTTTTQGLFETGIQTVIQTLISLITTSIVTGTPLAT
jgi:hypothetical protein